MINWKCLNCKKEFNPEAGQKRNKEFCSTDCAKEYFEKRAEILKQPINEEKFKQLLHKHKKDMLELGKIKGRLFGVQPEKYNLLFTRLKKQGKILSIVSARYVCEECGTDKNLTSHHLVTRFWKRIIRDFSKYLSVRYYFTNQILLCLSHHRTKHFGEVSKEIQEEMNCISEDYINKIRVWFEV